MAVDGSIAKFRRHGGTCNVGRRRASSDPQVDSWATTVTAADDDSGIHLLAKVLRPAKSAASNFSNTDRSRKVKGRGGKEGIRTLCLAESARMHEEMSASIRMFPGNARSAAVSGRSDTSRYVAQRAGSGRFPNDQLGRFLPEVSLALCVRGNQTGALSGSVDESVGEEVDL